MITVDKDIENCSGVYAVKPLQAGKQGIGENVQVAPDGPEHSESPYARQGRVIIDLKQPAYGFQVIKCFQAVQAGIRTNPKVFTNMF